MFQNAYPGIDIVFHGSNARVENDFEVAAGSDPSRIAFRLEGADRVTISGQGDLLVRRGTSVVVFKEPVAYQENGSHRTDVQAKYWIARDGSVRFRLGRYDHTRRLVIDPVVVFSTYFTGPFLISGMTTDAAGDIYLTGMTESTTFPVSNPEQPKLDSGGIFDITMDAFVSKFDPTGHTLLFSTYLGGSNYESAGSIAVSPNGNVIVSGATASADFPHAGAIVSPSFQGSDFFLTSLTPDGSRLVFSGLIGGISGASPYDDVTVPIAVDSQNNIYMAGASGDTNFQFTTGSLDSNPLEYPDSFMFFLKTDPTGKLVYSAAIPQTGAAPPPGVCSRTESSWMASVR